MEFDGLTFGAQVLNFLILVVLLRKFLYRPVTRALDRREEAIAGRWEEVREERETARERAEALARRHEELEEEREAALGEVRREAEELRGRLVEEARREAEEVRRRWLRSVELDREAFLAELRERTGREMYRTLRRALGDLADRDLEVRMVEVFLERLGGLSAAEREDFAEAAREAGGRAIVRTRFELPGELRERVAEAVREHLADDLEVRFEPTEDPLCGLELTAGDRKLAWSLESWIGDLEARVSRLLDARHRERTGRSAGGLPEVRSGTAAPPDRDGG